MELWVNEWARKMSGRYFHSELVTEAISRMLCVCVWKKERVIGNWVWWCSGDNDNRTWLMNDNDHNRIILPTNNDLHIIHSRFFLFIGATDNFFFFFVATGEWESKRLSVIANQYKERKKFFWKCETPSSTGILEGVPSSTVYLTIYVVKKSALCGSPGIDGECSEISVCFRMPLSHPPFLVLRFQQKGIILERRGVIKYANE